MIFEAQIKVVQDEYYDNLHMVLWSPSPPEISSVDAPISSNHSSLSLCLPRASFSSPPTKWRRRSARPPARPTETH